MKQMRSYVEHFCIHSQEHEILDIRTQKKLDSKEAVANQKHLKHKIKRKKTDDNEENIHRVSSDK